MATVRLLLTTVLWLLSGAVSSIQIKSERPLLDLNDRLLQLVLQGGGNEVVSPPAVYQVVAGAYQLGDDATRRLIEQVLGTDRPGRTSSQLGTLAEEEPSLDHFFRAYTTPQLLSECDSGQLRSLSKRSRCDRIQTLMRQSGQLLNLSSPDALSRINQDVSTATGGQIQQLFSFLDTQTRLVLVSALAFSAEWQPDLLPMPTGLKFFSGSLRQAGRVPAVQISAPLRFLKSSGDGVIGAAVPYLDQNLQLEMFFFIAEDINSDVTQLLRREHYERLAAISPLDTRVTITFPKFSLQSKKHDYLDVVRALGLSAVLEGGLGPEGGDKVDQLVHKSVMEVDERGTRAAGAAGASIIPRVGSDESAQLVQLLVDRPFVASVVHTGEVLPLFTAHVSEPLAD